MSLDNIGVRFTHQPDAKGVGTDRSIGNNWKRTSGQDAKGAYRAHKFKTHDNEGNSYQLSFKFKASGDELVEVIAIKSFKSTMKSLSKQNATFVTERLKKGEVPLIKMIKNKEGKVLAAVPVFPGNNKTEGHPYCFLRDGTILHLCDGDTSLTQEEIDAVLIEKFQGSAWSKLMSAFGNSAKDGELVYKVTVTHMQAYKKAHRPEIHPQFNDTRMHRAEQILTQLQNGDNSSISAKRVNPPPPPSSAKPNSIVNEEEEDEDLSDTESSTGPKIEVLPDEDEAPPKTGGTLKLKPVPQSETSGGKFTLKQET